MRELNVNEIEQVNGGMIVFWAAYVILGPIFAAGVAVGVAEE